jgi:VWFA-related protein
MATRRAAILLALFLSAAGPSAGQNGAGVSETVNVRVMDLDVVVSDKDGRPVNGLAREEFQVKIDKKPVSIDYFASVREGAVHSPDLSTLSPDLILKQYEKDRAAFVPRHFLIFLDSQSISPGQRRRAAEALKDLVTRLGPSDEALLISESQRPRVLSDWTTSKEELLAALDAAAAGGVDGLKRMERERQTLREIDMTSRVDARVSRARMYEEEVWEDTKRLLRDLGDSLALLSGKPGKKIFVNVSGGFELQPGSAVLAYAERRSFSGSSFRRDVTPELKKLTDLANAREITIFSLDTRGLAAPAGEASNESPLFATSLFAREDSQAGLALMAEETGGRAILNQNNFAKGLETVYRDTSSYYSLGVDLKNVAPGESHKVEVTVGRPSLVVRARRSYAVEDDESRVQDRVEATLLTNAAYADLSATLRTGPALRDKSEYLLPIEVEVPIRDLVFLPDGDRATARLIFYVAAIDDRGDRAPLSRLVQGFTIPASETRAARPIIEKLSLRMKKGNYRIVVNVRDAESGRIGTARANMHVE